MDSSGLVEKVQELTDLELAILLSLVAGHHCIIKAEQDVSEPLNQELQLDIQTLSELGEQATISAEVKAYLHNIVTFLRMHRAVGGGISPRATQHFNILVRCLAPLHGLKFVTPSLVALAARKIYSHRISILNAQDERSMQYGSDLAAVKTILEGITPEQVIDFVLDEIEVPL
ncbi:hypothetical protein P7C71_g1412, partial [Lecanoromycetidae sp. Uapishka_2]